MKKNYDFAKARRGPIVQPPASARVSIYLDDELLKALREGADAAGCGYQTMINEALREYLGRSTEPVDVATIRRIIRQDASADAPCGAGRPRRSGTEERVRRFARRSA